MTPFNRLFSIMKRPWVIGASVFVLVILYMAVDKPLAEYLYSLSLRDEAYPLIYFTKLGLSVPYLIGFLLAALWFRYIRINAFWEARFWFVWICVVFSGGICGMLKVLFGRARPDMWFEQKIWGFYGFKTIVPYWSFPSGHTTTIMSVCLALGVVFPRFFSSFTILGLLVALSRMLLTQHYLTDVLVACYFAVLEIGFLVWIMQKKSWLQPAWDVE